MHTTILAAYELKGPSKAGLISEFTAFFNPAPALWSKNGGTAVYWLSECVISPAYSDFGGAYALEVASSIYTSQHARCSACCSLNHKPHSQSASRGHCCVASCSPMVRLRDHAGLIKTGLQSSHAADILLWKHRACCGRLGDIPLAPSSPRVGDVQESRAEKRSRVEQLLDRLALRTCQDTHIGDPMSRGVSGGQVGQQHYIN